MANRKKEIYKPKPMTDGKKNIIQWLLQEYEIKTADDIQEALKDLLCGTIQEMLEAEMDNHLGYAKYERSSENNSRNGTKSKRVRSINTVSLKWLFLRTGKAPLNPEFYQNARKIFQKLRTKSFPCMLKE